MSRVLRWTTESRETFNQNLEYLSEEWDFKVINNFLDRVEEALEQIRSNPELYPLYRPTDKVYRCIIHKRVVLYYRIVDDKHIDLLTFWSTYQDPDKLNV
jgi:plasmid stabilization system protein ParE